jgi:hypothetical protein
MREIETAAPGVPPTPPAGEPLEAWDVAAVGPAWRPPPGETELLPVPGRLELYPDAIVFRSSETIDRRTGEPVVEIVPSGEVTGAGPLSPGARVTSTELAGQWMPRALRRLRCPGFVVSTSDGSWLFDCPHGVRRAREVSGRYQGTP